jgi:hypothetical protein
LGEAEKTKYNLEKARKISWKNSGVRPIILPSPYKKDKGGKTTPFFNP